MTDEERTKYKVVRANIADEDGKKVLAGSIVELGKKLAKHYNNLGYLAPYIPDDEDEEDEGGVTKSVSPQRERVRRPLRSARTTDPDAQLGFSTGPTSK